MVWVLNLFSTLIDTSKKQLKWKLIYRYKNMTTHIIIMLQRYLVTHVYSFALHIAFLFTPISILSTFANKGNGVGMNERSSEEIRKGIYEYDNYRTFLCEFFEAKKRENHRFSQRQFCAKCGFAAHNFVTFVVKGTRNLSHGSIQKVIKGLGLEKKEAHFFENLVLLNQAKTVAEKERYFHIIKSITKKSRFYRVNKDQFFFYEKWYYPVVRELMVLSNWQGDVQKLAKQVRPTIRTEEAREATNLLLKRGMVIKKADASYELAHALVTSTHVPAYIKRKSRRDVLLKGAEIIDNVAPKEKYLSYVTIPMSKKLYGEVRQKLDDVRQAILSYSETDTNPEEIYEVVLQVFPVSQMKKGAGNDL